MPKPCMSKAPQPETHLWITEFVWVSMERARLDEPVLTAEEARQRMMEEDDEDW